MFKNIAELALLIDQQDLQILLIPIILYVLLNNRHFSQESRMFFEVNVV